MNIHKNARLTPLGREHLVRAVLGGQTPEAAARAILKAAGDHGSAYSAYG